MRSSLSAIPLLPTLSTDLCFANTPSIRVVAISGAEAMRGHEAQETHLRKLRQLGILGLRNDGKMAYYSLRDRFAAELATHAVRKAAA